MQHHQYAPQSYSQPTSLILASLLTEPQTATTLREAVFRAGGQMIEPGAFSRLLARLEQRCWMVSDEGEKRLRLYHITASGRLALQQLQMEQQKNQEDQEQNAGWHRGKEHLMRLVLWLLHLYPPAWRKRYEMEMVALLEQHQITLWTVLDLLVGVLDARLDPHYRQPRQLLPLRRFQSSWRLAIGAFVVFWFALLPWFWLNVLGISGAQCGNWSDFSYCMFRSSLGSYGPTFSHALIGMILALLPILLVAFTLTLVQARKRRARVHLVLAFFITLGMLVISMACGLWYLALWQILPQINQFATLTPVGLLLGLIGMALATVLSGAALLRATVALRALSAASPRQEFNPVLASVQAERQVEQADNLLESQTEPRANTAQPEPSTRSSISAQGKKSSWLLKGVLAMLLLLILLPWPSFVSPDVSFQDLLSQLFFASIVGGVTALLVMGRGKRSSEPAPGKHHFRDGLSLAVTALLAFFMILAVLLPRLAAWLSRPPGFVNWSAWTLLIFLACLCIFPALVFRAQARNTHSKRAPHRRGNLSPQAWIIILPVWFLAACMELEYLFLPDYNSFAEVFVAWFITGLAGLIIALAVKLGSKEQVDLSRQEAL